MKSLLLAFFALAFVQPARARNFSGYLVDGSCYAMRESNTNPLNADDAVNRDRDLEIRLCYPNSKTRQFAFVDHDGTVFRLDSAGDDKSASFVRQMGKRKSKYLSVAIFGEVDKNILKIDSISLDP